MKPFAPLGVCRPDVRQQPLATDNLLLERIRLEADSPAADVMFG